MAPPTFTHSPTPLLLPPSSPHTPPTPLLTLCRDSTPPCTLNPLLFNGHLQTAWTVLKGHADVPIHYKRHTFTSDPEESDVSGTFGVDFVVPAYYSSPPAKTEAKAEEEEEEQKEEREKEKKDENATLPPRTTFFTPEEFSSLGGGLDDDKPMLVVLHGLSGGSHELYLRHCLRPLVENGWEACVVNSRGCAKTRITSGVLYNARATWDVRQVVRWCRERWPRRRLFGLGFSLGGNILVNYLGEEGDRCLLEAAVVCSNPWNLDLGSKALQRTWLGLAYSRAMGASMRALFETHVEEISKNTNVDVEKVRNGKYLFEFDRDLQGPTWGYPTEGAYYRDASSCDSLLAVRIPLFAIHAADDPIAVEEALPIEEFKRNPYTVLCTTPQGGHLGWFQSDGGRWFEKPVSQFLQRMAKDVDLDKLKEETKQKSASDSHPNASFLPMRRKLKLHIER